MYVKFVVSMHASPKSIWHCVNAHVICCGVPQVHSINLCNYWLRNSTINLDYSKCESVLKVFWSEIVLRHWYFIRGCKWSTHWRDFIYWSGIWKHWVLLCAVLWQFLLFASLPCIHLCRPSGCTFAKVYKSIDIFTCTKTPLVSEFGVREVFVYRHFFS